MKKGWETQTLGDLCTFENGDRGENYPSKSVQTTSGVPFINAGHLTEAGIDFSGMTYIPRERFELLGNGKIRKNDILFCLRGSLGKFACVGDLNEGAIASSLIIIRPNEQILNKFLCAYLQSGNCAEMIREFRNGAAQPNLAAASLKKFVIPIPPLPEQRRIVGILDEAFAGLATAEANAARNLQNAREIFDSHLQAVFSQRREVLQEGGPEAAATTKGWVRRRLAELTTKIGSGATPQGGEANYKRSGISLIRSLNVHDCEFRLKDLAFIDETQARQLDNVSVEPWDVLLNITGASVARCCIVPNDLLPARVNQHVSILRPIAHELSPQFLQYLLVSGDYKNRLLTAGDGGATRQALTKSQLQDFEIEIPPLPEQRRIVEELNDLRRQAAKLDKVARQKQSALAELKKSLLHTAFNGDL